MSAIEAISPIERRSAERLRPVPPIRVTVGRGDGSMLDLSRGGMRVRHSVPATRGTEMRVSFEWQKERFVAIAEVLASRVVSIGNSQGSPTMFDTRLRFGQLTPHSRSILERLMTAIHSRELRRWTANMQGWSDETIDAHRENDGSFLRCRLIGQQWKRTWTHDPLEQPSNGFVLPGTIGKLELETLCDTYLHANADERHLIRLMAEEAVREAMPSEEVASSR